MTELGIVEGYFGRPWSWEDRTGTMRFLADAGYRFFLYAPKADAYLRRNWRQMHPETVADELATFAAACREAGVRFGIGLSPYEAYRSFDSSARSDLLAKLAQFDALGIEDLAILFDDMQGDLPDLAERQARIIDTVAGATRAGRLYVCPTYYSDDPVLDRVFGPRPPGYLRKLGHLLDPAIRIFWTGEEVCSREFRPAYLDGVAEILGRRPTLWDNYPVNDGARMSQYLHLRAFTGRGAELSASLDGHAVNPALQPVLTRIPCLTLAESYRSGRDYRYGAALREAARRVLGDGLADRLIADLMSLQDVGLDRLGERASQLRMDWQLVAHPAAREIIGWLDGEYRISDDLVKTQ